MASIKIANKNFMSQSGNDEPAITSNVTFPAGHVVQVVFNQYDAFVTSTGATMQPTGLKVQITPKFENSKFYVFGGGPLNARPAGRGCGVSIYARNTLGTMSSWNLLSGKSIAGGYLYDVGSSDTWSEGNTQGYGAGPSYNLGETLEFEIYFGSIGPGTDGSTTVRFGHPDFSGNIMAMEIAG